jgi:hypothetical protein
MFAFNTNRPTDLQSIEGALSSYATPEAAVSDFDSNAPRGRDYLIKQYQTLLGDAFADPFADMAKSENSDMVKAAMGGASIATGSNMGMRLLSQPMAPAPATTAATTGPTIPLPTLSPLGNNEVTRDNLLRMMQMKGNADRLASSDMQIPAPNSSGYMDVLGRRAALAGVSNEFGRINPSVFTTPVDANDPRFARTQAGKAIGMDIHPVAYDPNFQEIARRDPAKAAALYRATTNRDYDTDVKAKSQLLVEQRDARKKIIEDIKSLEADPVTGDLYKTINFKDFDGTIKQQRLPVTPLDRAAIEAEGGAKRIYGVDLPGQGGLPKLPGMTDQELVQYRSRTQQLMKEKGLDVQSASALAHRMLYAEQNSRNAPVTTTPQRPGFQRALESLTDANISGANVVPKLLNFMLSRGAYTDEEQAPIPLIPHPDWNKPANASNLSLMDILRESANFARGYPAGRDFGNRPLAVR